MADHKNHADAQSVASLEAAQRELAYLLWERDGRPEGRSDFYWHRAGEEMMRTPSGANGAAANGKSGEAEAVAKSAAKPRPRASRKNAADAGGEVKPELAAAAAPKPRARAGKPVADPDTAPKAKAASRRTTKAKA
jgi:hypothetical protein